MTPTQNLYICTNKCLYQVFLLITITTGELDSVIMWLKNVQIKIGDLRWRSEDGFDNRDLHYLSFELQDIETDVEHTLEELDQMYRYSDLDLEADDIFDKSTHHQRNVLTKKDLKEVDDWMVAYGYRGYGARQQEVATGDISTAFIHKTAQRAYVSSGKKEKTISGFLIVKEG